MRISPQRWYDIDLNLNCATQTYALRIDGVLVRESIPFTEPTESLERIVFRTGPYRGMVPSYLVKDGGERPSGLEFPDLPGADEPAAVSVYWIDDLETR